jgi:hypothetical protein
LRVAIAILLIVYLIGVGVDLAPAIWSGWSSGNGSIMLGSITRAAGRPPMAAVGVSEHLGEPGSLGKSARLARGGAVNGRSVHLFTTCAM